MTENSTVPKTLLRRRFTHLSNISFLPSSKKNKNNIDSKTGWNSSRAKRITPPAVAAVAAALAVFFLQQGFSAAQALAETGYKPAEIIVCPEKTSAEAGSLVDEYYLARAYDKGYCGITVNKKSAEEWYIKAAKHGHVLAQHYLGDMYFAGNENAPSDYQKARQWYLAAALQGYGPAQLRLGFLYVEAHFKGLAVNYAEAEKWFLKAAEQNAGDAQFRLGNFYHNYKRPPDKDKAILWLTLAAEGGHSVAMFDLARLLKDKKMPEQALGWMKKAAELNLLPAQMTLSEMYATGNNAPKDPAQSLFWTLKVAAVPAISPFWLNKAADIFFEGGPAIPKDYPQALKFYEQAAAKDDPHALARLGLMHLKGLGVPADGTKARAYLEKAAAKSSPEAQYLLKGSHDDKPPEK